MLLLPQVQQIRSEVSTDDAAASREDNMKDVGMASTFSAILIQSSQHLYDVALRKVLSHDLPQSSLPVICLL